MDYVVLGVTYSCYTDPPWEHEPGVFKAASKGEDRHGEVRIDGVDGEQTDYSRLGSVVDEPVQKVC